MSAIGLILITLGSVATGHSLTDFTGAWSLDVARSKSAEAAIRPISLSVEQTARHFAILEIIEGTDGRSLRQQNFSLGQPTQSGAEMITARRVGKAIRILRSIQNRLIISEEWRLSDGGAELFIKRKCGHLVQLFVFKRARAAIIEIPSFAR
jgi:hypothetical protein